MKRLPESYTEDILVNKLKGGDKKAFSILYDHYSAALFGVINRIVKNDELAQDILQETFMKIYQRIELYDASKSRLFTWLLNIARNASFDNLRKGRSALLIDIDAINLPEIDAHYQVNLTGVDFIGISELVSNLSPGERNLIDLIYFNGYTMAETADTLQIPLGTVKTKVRSTLQKLRRYTRC